MWSDYHYKENDLVKVRFNGGINESKDFEDFIQKWKELYEEKKEFSFLFDTINTSFVNPYYSYMMANFIRELKKESKQYLNYSVIIVKNYYIRMLLNIIFAIQKPVAPVFLIENNSSNNELIKQLNEVKSDEELKKILEDNRQKFSIVNI